MPRLLPGPRGLHLLQESLFLDPRSPPHLKIPHSMRQMLKHSQRSSFAAVRLIQLGTRCVTALHCMYCTQCIAVHNGGPGRAGALHCTALHRPAQLQYSAVRRRPHTVQCSALHCSALRRIGRPAGSRTFQIPADDFPNPRRRHFQTFACLDLFPWTLRALLSAVDRALCHRS